MELRLKQRTVVDIEPQAWKTTCPPPLRSA